MSTEQIKQNISVVDVLDKYLGLNVSTGHSLPCPIHGGDNPTGFSIDKTGKLATCWTMHCNEGKPMNVIDLTMEIHKTDFKGAVSLLEKDFLQGDTNTTKTKRKAFASVPAPTNAKKNFNRLYKTLSHDDYFLNRGLSLEIIEKYGLGAIEEETDLSGFNQKEKAALKFWRYIIPVSERFFVARLDDTKAEGNRYLNFGQAELLNNDYIGDTSKTFVFVTEGAFDALSIETLGYPAIALNSVSNASLFVREIGKKEQEARQQQFILLADNDEAGKELEQRMKDAFKKMNMNIYVHKWYEQHEGIKDINELASNNPDSTTETLETAMNECINGHSAINTLVDFFTNMEKVDPIQITEFPKLNEVIGGLRTGLYVVGAASSLGKTTFVQEIADNVASQGEHVLFFSLEMSKKELIAKSLVRTMGEVKRVMKTPGEITYTRDLLNGNIKDYDIFTQAIGLYGNVAKNLFIYEGMFDMNVYVIRQEIEKHIRLHNRKPLVIVDYLQILEPLNDRLTEKQATDKNITELKRITRDLDIALIAISSFNRDGYNKEASFSSFKESGSIEYGSDVVIALELEKIKELEVDKSTGKVKGDQIEALNKAKGSLVRDINLKILKNRFGKAFEEIQYSYITTMNKFVEK